MARIFKRERAAACLADALYYGDKEACAKYGVSIQSLDRWRRLIDGEAPRDPVLSSYVARNLIILQTQWLSKLPKSLEETVEALRRFASKKNHDPSEVSLLIESLKMQAQVQLANRLVDEQRAASRSDTMGRQTPALSGTEVEYLSAPEDGDDPTPKAD